MNIYQNIRSALVTAAAATLMVPFSASAQNITLSFSDLFPAQYPFGELTEEYAERISEATDGAVQIDVYPSGSLTPPGQCYEGVVQGLSDICQAVLAYTPGRFPVMSVVDLPGYPVNGHITTGMANAIYQEFQPAEFDDVHILYFHAHPPGHILTVDTPVDKLEDFRGLRIRSTGLSAEIVSALGAAPVSMPITEAYDPLRRSVVDGTDGSFNTLRYYRFAEVTNYSIQSTDVGYVSTFAVVMNKDKWDSLSEDVQAAFEEVNQEFIDRAAELWNEIELDGYNFALEAGHTFIKLEDDEEQRLRETVLPVLRDGFLERVGGAGLPAEDILTARDRVMEELSARHPPLEMN